ncbi:uncharacterized protein LOC114828591 [Galendromus occidentalis]|uniref:Uncharacterized protein LOC114828591 n=1 Tax=Galendromus occidentalis TaxID=34638 RepID=A0AAJ7SJA3_9ACAR|nr:uncharacterized protein LOC114828591 [Galendromus occidentalis]
MATAFIKWLDAKRQSFVDNNPQRIAETRVNRSAGKKQILLDQALEDFITDTMVPLRVVERDSFKKLLDTLDFKRNGFKLMSRRTLGRRLGKALAEYQKHLRNLLAEPTWVSTTADVWSGGQRSFLGMTVHWIDAQYNRRTAPLACQRFPGSQTYDRVASLVNEIHRRFCLSPSKVTACVTDNGSNFVKAFVEFGVLVSNLDELDAERDETNEQENSDDDGTDQSRAEDDYQNRESEYDSSCYDEEEYASSQEGHTTGDTEDEDQENEQETGDQLDTGSWVSLDESTVLTLPAHARCAAHTLSLCATSDVKKVFNSDAALKLRHELVIARCNILWNMARRPKTAEIIKNMTGRSLPRPCATRWNSLYDSLLALLKLRYDLPRLMAALQRESLFSDEDFAYIEEYIKCSKPVAVGLDKLQAEKTGFYGALVPTLHMIRRQLSDVARAPLRFCKPLLDGLIQSVEKRFKNILDCRTVEGQKSAIAALSMPLFKNAWCRCITPEDQSYILGRFRELIRAQIGTESSETEPEPMETDDYYDFGGEATSSSATLMQVDSAEVAMQNYLGDARTALVMLEKHPLIAPIFRQYNTQPPSSAEVERLFSLATMINAPRANRLSDARFEQRVVLRKAMPVFDF